MPTVKKNVKTANFEASTESVNVNSSTTQSNISDPRDDKIAELQKQIEELTKKINAPVEKMTNPESKSTYNYTTEQKEYVEPSPNKQIRIISLYYGELNLSTEPYGKGKLLSFSKYGEVKTVLYSTLIDIVNTNRKFAEDGSFYILDRDATYYLGLSEIYTNILSKDIMDKICNYSASEIVDLLNNATDEQKSTIVHNICDRIYNGESVDLNKCDVISKCCGVNIMNRVDEMKKFSGLDGSK